VTTTSTTSARGIPSWDTIPKLPEIVGASGLRGRPAASVPAEGTRRTAEPKGGLLNVDTAWSALGDLLSRESAPPQGVENRKGVDQHENLPIPTQVSAHGREAITLTGSDAGQLPSREPAQLTQSGLNGPRNDG